MQRGTMFQFFEWNSRGDGGLWRELASRAKELRDMGITAVWMPPAHKGMSGAMDVGYGTYDIYDLGEFDQKGSVRTKYGTRQEYLDAIRALKEHNLHSYADVVLNHRMGGDATEEVEIEEVNPCNRNEVQSAPYRIQAWSRYEFPGRNGKYSPLKLRAEHFNAFGCNAAAPDDCNKIYRLVGKGFSGEVCCEFGNFDYLMGADVDTYHPEVREDLFRWGEWFMQTTGIDGFRLDAVKHIPASFYRDWFRYMKDKSAGQELFGVGEYWSTSLDELKAYLGATEGMFKLFDVPLHYKLQAAANAGRDFDLSKIFDGTLVQDHPVGAVTFVDNHDTQPGQGLTSWVNDWFKPMAYALILLREQGYPCVFYGDYYGNPGDGEGNHQLKSHQHLLDIMLKARLDLCHGEMTDYFDHPQCVGWFWSGDDKHPGSLAVLMSTGDAGMKKMQTKRPNATFRDLTGHYPEPMIADENGEVEFRCPPGNFSLWTTA